MAQATQVQKFYLGARVAFQYNIYMLRRKGNKMNDFFRQDQADWYQDWVDSEVHTLYQPSTEQTLQDIKDFDLDIPFWIAYNIYLDSAETTLKGHMMTAQTKPQNYTEAQTLQVVQAYQAGESVEAIATQVGKSVRSIVAKLAREGVYVAKTKQAGNARVTKAEMVAKIAAATGAELEVLASLEKATHEALEVLVAKLQWDGHGWGSENLNLILNPFLDIILFIDSWEIEKHSQLILSQSLFYSTSLYFRSVNFNLK